MIDVDPYMTCVSAWIMNREGIENAETRLFIKSLVIFDQYLNKITFCY